MKPSELKKSIAARHKAGIERAIHIKGAPGGGKTEIAGQAAKELGIGYKVIHAPLLQPEDYGFPVIAKERNNVDFVVSSEKFPIEGSDCPDEGILLIDELPQADNSAQKILANLLQAREIHGKKIKKGWTIVSTGNRTTDRAGANQLLSHLKDRVTEIDLDISVDDWTEWALANNIKLEVIGFVRFRPALLSAFDPQQEKSPTPRGWCQGVSAALGVVDPSLEFEFFKGDVGEAAAAEFCGFLKIFRELPSPDAILISPATTAVPTGSSVLYAIAGALAARTTGDNFDRVMTYVSRMPKEFSVLFIREAIRRNKDLQTTTEFIKWSCGPGKKLLT